MGGDGSVPGDAASRCTATGSSRGLEQGLGRGRAEGRALVGRLATRKFGAETAEQLSRVLEDIADPERLAEREASAPRSLRDPRAG